MSKNYDLPAGYPFTWDGWSDGEDECDPPEPGKYWLTVRDCDGEEYCTIVHRGDTNSPAAARKEERAAEIVRCLNGEY